MIDDVAARALLILWDSEQFDTADLARVTGFAEGSIEALIHRARGVVREMYREERQA